MAEKKKKLNKGLDAIFGGDITSLIDDIEHNTPESSQEKIKLDEIDLILINQEKYLMNKL